MQSDVQFDQQETELMFNTSVFPLKRQINRKLYVLFEQIKNALKDTPIHQNFPFPAGVDNLTGKISQGENHQEFPWVMLDFPKLFTPERIFAYRTLFWYGRGFSNALLIGGNVCDQFAAVILKNRKSLSGKDIYFSFAPDAWDHNISSEHAQPVETVSDEQVMAHIQSTGYIKLSCGYTSADAGEIMQQCVETYDLFLKALL